MRKLRAINTVLWWMNGRIPNHWETIRFYQQCVLPHRPRRINRIMRKLRAINSVQFYVEKGI